MSLGSDRLEQALLNTAASLAAAISHLERTDKKTAASDKMFDQMLTDYRKSLEEARGILRQLEKERKA